MKFKRQHKHKVKGLLVTYGGTVSLLWLKTIKQKCHFWDTWHKLPRKVFYHREFTSGHGWECGR